MSDEIVISMCPGWRLHHVAPSVYRVRVRILQCNDH
eukprot:COSAG02_NODE_22_length_53020_cov_16.223125_17_plen_36_part_00